MEEEEGDLGRERERGNKKRGCLEETLARCHQEQEVARTVRIKGERRPDGGIRRATFPDRGATWRAKLATLLPINHLAPFEIYATTRSKCEETIIENSRI